MNSSTLSLSAFAEMVSRIAKTDLECKAEHHSSYMSWVYTYNGDDVEIRRDDEQRENGTHYWSIINYTTEQVVLQGDE